MSGMAVSGLVQSGLLARLVSDNTTIQTQENKLTLQASSGKVATTYGGLGAVAHVSVDLRPQMAQVGAWQQSIAMASGQLATTQSVLGQLHDIASQFSGQALGVALQSTTGATAVATQAQGALQQVLVLLNTQSDGQYAFAGANSGTAPLDAGALSALTASAAAAVSGLSTGADPATVLSTVVSGAAQSSFTYPLPGAGTAPAALLAATGDGQSVPMGFVAGRSSFAAPASGGTGSYVRDLVAGLAALAGLGTTTASEPVLQTYGIDVSQLLQGAAGAISTEQAGFGQVQAQLTTQGTTLADTLTSLTGQVTGAEDVDMTATATALSQVQTQLQASYKLIAGIKDLSLTAYL